MNEESYILGSYALWAGDYDRAKELFASHPPISALPPAEGFRKAADLIALAQEQRHSQIVRLSQEFHQQVASLPGQFGELTAGGLQLRPTDHLAGVLFRNGARQFEMRAYLTDLGWAKQLVTNARALALKWQDSFLLTLPADSGDVSQEELQEDRPATGYSWETLGRLIIETHVSRLGLITAQGFWTDSRLPKTSYEEIERPFRSVLLQLDPESHNTPATSKHLAIA